MSSSSTSGDIDLFSSILKVIFLIADSILSPRIILLRHYYYHGYHDLLLCRWNSHWFNVHFASSERDFVGFGICLVYSKESHKLKVCRATCERDLGQVLHLNLMLHAAYKMSLHASDATWHMSVTQGINFLLPYIKIEGSRIRVL